MILTYTYLLHNIHHHLLTASLGTVFWQHRETIWNIMKPVPNQSLQCPSFVAIAHRKQRFSRHLASASLIGTRSPRADSTAMGSDSVENIAFQIASVLLFPSSLAIGSKDTHLYCLSLHFLSVRWRANGTNTKWVSALLSHSLLFTSHKAS